MEQENKPAKLKLLRTALIDYPSASAVEMHDGILYLIGDDINFILCLDEEWKPFKIIQLFEYAGSRIPKPEKPDLESAVILDEVLYIAGSGSVSPQRDVAFIVQLKDETVKKINTSSFYSLFRDMKLIGEMNIEGLTICRDKLLFFNRGNLCQPNQLIITDHRVIKRQFPGRFKVMPLTFAAGGDIPFGVSGACYHEGRDVLLITASAEHTSNAYDDGEIAGSAIGIISNASKKLENTSLDVDDLVLLDLSGPQFHKQKIESICIAEELPSGFKCILVADNDDGSSVLFEIELQL